MTHETLALIWFVLVGVLLAGYAILDGFDLGVGILHPFVPRSEAERRVSINAIGPIWDGNEVWLITFGGALFAAFPAAYASIFSGFYVALHLVLLALILRAVSLELRGKIDAPAWRRLWDAAFFLGSALATLLFGVAVGNAMMGVPLDDRGDFTTGLLAQVNPYALVVGLFALAMFAMHGAIFLNLKTTGDLHRRLYPWMWRTFGLFLVMYMFTTIYTLVAVPHATENIRRLPWLWIVPALNVLAIANIPRALYYDRPLDAFISSCAAIVALIVLFSVALYPNLVTALDDPARSVTVYNAASSERTLRIMLVIAAIGMPFVLAYTAAIYWTFRGRVDVAEAGY